ncbi:hypothetical protein [Flavicella sediminum]|uniref:hypothetical protein n=1 Tax=Flavicella sediminum TaxID=2585141 RepID=UPI00112226D6|nr:hypothetical protein [Flavicella sediminum]
MILYSLLLIILSIALIYYKQYTKLKDYNYNISTRNEENRTVYYIVFELKHGTYIDTITLSKKFSLFLPQEVKQILTKEYDCDKSAIEALDTFKKAIHHRHCIAA